MARTITRFGVREGIGGWFAVCYDAHTGEAIQTGIGRYVTADEAHFEATEWAASEGRSGAVDNLYEPTLTRGDKDAKHSARSNHRVGA